MQQPQPVIRTYRGRDRHGAQEAYRIDQHQAAAAWWFPVAHRWAEGWDGPTLSVVFEYRPAGPSPTSPTGAAAPMAGPVAHPGAPAAPSGPTAGPGPASAARAHARATVTAIDVHCAGEPLRLIRSGFPQPPFAPILERRRWAREHADEARRVAMFEPRGHRDMYGAILLAPFRPEADIGVLFMHTEGWSTMCGHGIIAIATALLEERLYEAALPETTIRFEVPAGLVTAHARVAAGAGGGPEVESVRFTNVPSYLVASGIALRPDGVDLAGLAADEGTLRVDLAFGGAYYGIVDAADLGIRVVPAETERLTRAGAAITELLRRHHRPDHPTDPDLGFVYGTVIVDGEPASSPDGRARDADIRNVTIFADAEVDRSPCGSGTSAILAQRFFQGRLEPGRDLVNASITGEAFRARVGGSMMLASQDAIETSVEGTAYVSGYPTFVVDDRDPLGGGFLLR